jgi:hypothetical protein
MQRFPLSLPLSKVQGATPRGPATCLRLMLPSSGKSAIRVQARTGPTPGMEERGIGSYDLDQVCVQHIDIGCQPTDSTTRKPQQHCVFQHRGGILDGNLLIAELATNSQHLSKSLNRQRVPLCSAGRHDGDKGRNYSRIEPIAFRQNSAGFGKLLQLERVDLVPG